jgi:hypothetical protein
MNINIGLIPESQGYPYSNETAITYIKLAAET